MPVHKKSQLPCWPAGGHGGLDVRPPRCVVKHELANDIKLSCFAILFDARSRRAFPVFFGHSSYFAHGLPPIPQPPQPDIGQDVGGAFCWQLPAHRSSHVAELHFAHGWAQVQPAHRWVLQQASVPCSGQPSHWPGQVICTGALDFSV